MDLRNLENAKRRVGGSFRLSVLLQKRIIELVRGAPPVIETGASAAGPIDIALREILEEKITLEMIPEDEFEKLVEQARLEKEGRIAASPEAESAFGPPPTAMPTIDLAQDAVANPAGGGDAPTAGP